MGGAIGGGPNVADLSSLNDRNAPSMANVPAPPDTSLSAPLNSRMAPTLPANIQGPSMANRIATKAGQYATALQPLFNAIPGMQGQQQQQSQQARPVNFAASPAPYIPPPGAGSSNLYGY